jgi:hypothetical protein
MPENIRDTTKRKRLDHVLPQGYLDGFTNPSNQGQVSVFDRQEKRWFDTGTAGIGAIRGFYDYAPGTQPDETADHAFARLEAKFPVVRRNLIQSGFAGWVDHLDFLLDFAQMLRARSQLFREQHVAHSRELTILKVEELLHREPSKTHPGTFDTTLKVGPYAPESENERETLFRNKAITDMRAEIAGGPTWFSTLHWCLRSTADPTDPVVTADNAVVVEGKAATLGEALAHQNPETLLFFSISWQACLIGCPVKFDKETDAFHPSDLRKLRALCLKSARRFVFSPVHLNFPEAGQ